MENQSEGCWLGASKANNMEIKKNTVRYHDTWNAQSEFPTSAKLNQMAPRTMTVIGVSGRLR